MSTLIGIALVVALQAAGTAQPHNATGLITGVVVSADSDSSPVRRAIVTISGGGISEALSTVSDDSGRFAFTGLAAGRYNVAVRKAAWLPMVYGAPAPGKPGTPVLLASGGKADIRVPIARGAVIAGTVRDAQSNPVPGVPVYALPTNVALGARTSSDAVITDDRGAYRIFGLASDEYLVVAAPRVSTTGSEMLGLSRAGIDARLRALEQRHGAPGAAVTPVGAAAATPTGQDRPQPMSIAPVFYPGTPAAARAARIRAAAGEERGGVDIVLAPVPVVAVSGVIQQTGGIEVTRIRPDLTVIGPPMPSLLLSGPSLVGPAADGSFSFINVAPGRYALTVRTGQGASMSFADGRGFTSNNPGVPSLYAMTEFDVDGQDVTGLVMSLQPLPMVSGRIEFSGSAKPPANLATVQISAQALADPVDSPAGAWRPTIVRIARGMVDTDGSFEVAGMLPGRYTLNASVSAASSPWRARSAMLDGRDLLDVPLEIGPGAPDMSGVVITLADARSELAGTLGVPAGQTADRYAIVAFTTERTLWRPNGRRLRAVRPAPDGAFSIMDLPAGEYLLAAVEDVPPDDWQQTSFLEQLAAAAVKVTIRDGEKTMQSLRIAK